MVYYICDDCGKPIVKPRNSCGTGYAIYDDKHICYNCSGLRIRVDMITTGRAILYIPGKDTRYFRYVTDWPGVLKFEINRLTISLCPTPNGSKYQRIDVWFTGPDGDQWHGINQGDNEIVRCRRNTKVR